MALGGALGRAWAPVTPRHFAWQAWHKLTSTVVSRGRRGTNSYLLSFCVAGLGQMALGGALGRAWAPVTPRHFVWQAWHNLTSTFVSRGRRGTNSHLPSFCVAGVGQMGLGGALGRAWAPVTPRHFAWQAWHKLASTVVSRGRPGTNSHLLSFCVAGVGQMALGGALGRAWAPVTPRHFVWQAWHNLTSTFVSRGRRGTNSHLLSFCVAGVGQMALGGALGRAWAPVTPRHFAWQAWHKLTSTVVLRGSRGTDGTGWRAWTGLGACDAAALCVAGVAQPHIHLRFTWQAWHNVTSTVVLRGRRGTSFDTPSFTHHFVTHHLSHTIFHTQLCHPPSFTHHLSHTTLSPTIFDTPSFTHHLCNTPSFTHHLSHTIFYTQLCQTPSLAHQVSHTALSHTTLSHHLSPHHLPHTIFHHPIFHTQLCHTPSLTHHLSHTTLPHTVFHTQLCHTLSFTQDFHPHHLSAHHPSHTTLSHTIFHHTILHTQLCHTPSFATPSFTHHFVTQHLSHTTLSHTLFHTQLSHTQSFTHCFVTHTHTIFLRHTQTIFHIPLCHSQLF